MVAHASVYGRGSVKTAVHPFKFVGIPSKKINNMGWVSSVGTDYLPGCASTLLDIGYLVFVWFVYIL